jgi:formyl-CoA transferase
VSNETGPASKSALSGLKIVEFAQIVAGPLAGGLMADLGADVIHVESPSGGDSLRLAGDAKDGVYLQWKVTSRNKRSVTLDLNSEPGQEIAHKLVRWADVVIANFRPAALERWHLDWDSLHEINPKLIMLQVSGFGAHTQRRDEPGFGKVGEAMSGVVELTGLPGGMPLHAGFNHADAVTGVMGAFSVLAALFRRNTDPEFDGEWIDLALYETLFRIIEFQVIAYDQLGIAPTRNGNRMLFAPAAVVNGYLSADDHWITVTSATLKSVRSVAMMLGEDESNYVTRDQQRDRAEWLDARLKEWVGERKASEVLDTMRACGVVASTIYSVPDMLDDPTYQERENIVRVADDDFGSVQMQNVVPRLRNHTGTIWRSAPGLGQDNNYVYEEILGLAADYVRDLGSQGII